MTNNIPDNISDLNFASLSRALQNKLHQGISRLGSDPTKYNFDLVPPNSDPTALSGQITGEVQTYISDSQKITQTTCQTSIVFSILFRVKIEEGVYDLMETVKLVTDDFRQKNQPKIHPDPENPDDPNYVPDPNFLDSRVSYVGMSAGPGFPIEAQYVFPLQFTYSFLEPI